MVAVQHKLPILLVGLFLGQACPVNDANTGCLSRLEASELSFMDDFLT
jgi:hypothetical protein